MYKAQIYIDGERIDLFDDENIEVKSSVQNVKDISKVFGDFSKSFSVPASKRNNRLFRNFWNFTITNGFDARIRHDARLEIAHVPFRSGSIRLEKARIENNVAVSYRLTFFGYLINLKELIGNDYLEDLDFLEYEFDYTGANIRIGAALGLFDKDIIFPMIGAQRQWLFNTDDSAIDYNDPQSISDNSIDQENLVNIAYNNVAQKHGIGWTELRPAIRTIKIIEKIEEKYGLSFSRDFLGVGAMKDLYMWLANEDSEEALKNNFKVSGYDQILIVNSTFAQYDDSTGIVTLTNVGADQTTRLFARVQSNQNNIYTVQIVNNGEVVGEETGKNDVIVDVTGLNGVARGSKIHLNIRGASSVNFTLASLSIGRSGNGVTFDSQKGAFTTEVVTAEIGKFVPKIKVIEFIAWLIKKYNLTVVPTGEREFDVETLDEWYKKGRIVNIDKYVSTERKDVGRGVIYGAIKFNFKEPKTILANAFLQSNKTAYGDLETKLQDVNGRNLDGGELEIEVGFEQMIYERLYDQKDSSSTNIVYGLSLDKGLDSEVPKCHLMYAIQKVVTGNGIAFINESGNLAQVRSAFMPSHVNNLVTKEFSTVFGSEINEHDGIAIKNSLFKVFYQDYVTDMFNKRRRIISVEGELPVKLINTLKMNDRLVFGGDRYLINELNINLTTQEVSMELLNDIYNLDLVVLDEEEEPDVIIEEEDNTDPEPDTPTPVVGESFGLSSQSSSLSGSACVYIVNQIKYWNGRESEPTLGDIIYNNSGLSSPFDGGSKYFKMGNGNKIIRVGPEGRVYDVSTCIQGGGTNNQ